MSAVADDVRVEWRGRFTNDEYGALHGDTFDDVGERADWQALVRRHSLGWVTARGDDAGLAGFVHVVWDGSVHAWLQHVMVADRVRHRGVGGVMVARAQREAAAAGCEWLHVDFDPELDAFYIGTCGFERSSAGLLRLDQDGEVP